MMDILKNYVKNPMDIEKRSMEIIESEMQAHDFSKEELPVVKRVIHTTADFEYQNLIEFSGNPIEVGKELIKKGCKIYTDTNMVFSGINKRILSKYGCEIKCMVHDEDVVTIAKEKGITRSMAGIEKAAKEGYEIFAIGNAPTALFKIYEMIKTGEINPKLIIGVPVGFVGAMESKELLGEYDVPFIRINGRKGGSPVAATILNAIMYQL